MSTLSYINANVEDLLQRLYGGLDLVPEQYQQDIRIGAIGQADVQKDADNSIITDGRQHLWLFLKQAEDAKTRRENAQPNADYYYNRVPEDWKERWEGVDITDADWRPERVDKHTPEFRKFIGSSFPRFDKIIAYEPFFLCVEQCRRWLEEGTSIEDYKGEEQRNYAMQEFSRILQNRMYGMEKYGWIKDDEIAGGRRKYHASTPQALLIYLLDCGYSIELGKGRQAAITSTVMLYEVMTMLVRTSYKGVLVADDVKTTGQAILNDKFKSSFRFILDNHRWLGPPKVHNFAVDNVTFDWSQGASKTEMGMYASNYSIASAGDTQAINGQTPSKVVFDETQNIATYTAMKLEARPTMLSSDENGVINIKRQIVAYGTGSSNQSGKGVFENEYKSTMSNFVTGKDTSTFVPLFFDWTCRPNMTEERYRKEYTFYLNTDSQVMSGLGKEERAAAFHCAYPSRVEDMWMTSHTTIIPQLLIKSHTDRIYKKCHLQGLEPVPGRFEAVWDKTKPMPPGSYLPYFVRDAIWKPSRADDYEAPCKMLIERKSGWANRYVKGTDPIQSPTGTSMFASMVIDKAARHQEIENGNGEKQRLYKPVPACILNWKSPVVEENMLQSALMNLYYSNYGKRGCTEVFEINQGQSYEKFMDSPAMMLGQQLAYRLAMPKRYQGGGHHRGLSLKGGRAGGTKGHLYADVRNALLDMGEDIWFSDVFYQVEKVVVEERDGGFAYYPRNKNTDNDDVLDTLGFACIAMEVDGAIPVEVGTDAPRTRKELIWDHDDEGNLFDREVEVLVKY